MATFQAHQKLLRASEKSQIPDRSIHCNLEPLRSYFGDRNWNTSDSYESDADNLLTTRQTTVAAGNLPAPLPPSVEEAYRKKCIDLKRRLTEVEESNDAYRLRKVRLTRAIRKMRLERAYLLETLGKRMKKNGGGGNELQGYFDEESDGSSEGPPTPHEKPLRSKRSHRRTAPSPPPVLDAHANPQYQAPVFHAYSPSLRGGGGDSHPAMRSPTNGQQPPMPISQYNPTPEGHQPQPQPPSHTTPPNPLIPSLPPPTAFELYAEARFLSQPHTHSSKHASTPESLMQLAHDTWDTESEGVKQYYLLQESKAKEGHEAKLARVLVQQQQQEEERARVEFERERERADGERMEVDVAERVGEEEVARRGEASAAGAAGAGAGGFTSING